MNHTTSQSIPKVELHLHLDCSPSFDVLSRLDPELDHEAYARDIQLREKCRDLSDFLTKVPRILAQMQRGEHLREITLDLFRQLAADGVIYAEVRFAPLLHTDGGLSAEEVVATVDQAVTDAMAETGVVGRLLLCTLRHFSRAQGLETVALVRQFQNGNVVGLDLAADEAGFPLAAHVPAFEQAEKWGLYRTAHAGEALGPQSVRDTLAQLRPSRIGHGVRAIEDARLVDELAASQVHLEICPSCNVLIDVFPSMEAHSVNALLERGVSLGINTDGRTVPAVTLTGEYQRLTEVFGWGPKQFLATNRNALGAAFLEEDERRPLMEKLERGYGGLA